MHRAPPWPHLIVQCTKAINITSMFIVKHEQSSAHNEVSEKLTWVLDVKHRYGYRRNVIVWVNKFGR
jgi:hypothetical protein